MIAELEASLGSAHFEVWRQNWTVVCAFLATSTQWRMVPLADGKVYWQGLDYGSATAVLQGSGYALTPELWAGLRVMEGAAKDCLNGVKAMDE